MAEKTDTIISFPLEIDEAIALSRLLGRQTMEDIRDADEAANFKALQMQLARLLKEAVNRGEIL